MDEQPTVAPSAPEAEQSVPVVQNSKNRRRANVVSIMLLIIILLAIPVTVIYLGQQTRQQIKAAEVCKTPPIPDPNDCVNGSWKLYKDATGCIHFRCEL